MNNAAVVTNIVVVCGIFAITSCSMQEEKPAKPATPAPTAKAETKSAGEKAPEKAKAEKASGDIGLIDTEKNYMILVTKEGRRCTFRRKPGFRKVEGDSCLLFVTSIM